MGFITDLFTSSRADKAQQKAADKSIAASQQATDKTLALQKEIFDKLWGGTQVQRDAGDAATRQMAALMGLSLPASTPQAQTQPAITQPQVQPTAGNYGSYSPGYGGMVAMRDPESGLGMNAMSMGGAEGPQVQPQMTGNAMAIGGMPATTATGANAMQTDPTAWLRSTPGYEFNLKEGQRSLNTGLASQGRLFSGDAGREAVRYGQNYADRIYGDQWNRLAGIAGAGQTAQSQGAGAATNYANNSGNALQWNARNLSSSYQDKGNSTAGFWGNLSGSANNMGNALMMFAGG